MSGCLGEGVCQMQSLLQTPSVAVSCRGGAGTLAMS